MNTRQITGVFATEKYLPEPRLPGKAKLRLRPDWADFTRVGIGAVPYLLNHDKAEVVGKVVQAWYQQNEGYRFVADLPVDDVHPIERVWSIISTSSTRASVAYFQWATESRTCSVSAPTMTATRCTTAPGC